MRGRRQKTFIPLNFEFRVMHFAFVFQASHITCLMDNCMIDDTYELGTVGIFGLDQLDTGKPDWFTEDSVIHGPISSPVHIPSEELPPPDNSSDISDPVIDWSFASCPSMCEEASDVLDWSCPIPTVPLPSVSKGSRRICSTEDLEKSGISTKYTDGKRRHIMPQQAIDEITSWLVANRTCPYPTIEQKMDWCRRYEMPICQVNTFLVNRRIRILGRRRVRTMIPLLLPHFLVIDGRSLMRQRK